MSTQIDGYLTIEANSDLSASAWCGVTVNSSGKLVLPSANGQIIGVLQNKPVTGANQNKFGKVRIPGMGSCKAKAGGSVTAGDNLKVGADGRFSTASAGDVTAGYKVGVALESASANDVVEIVLTPSSGTVAVTGDETVTTGALSASTTWSYLSTTAAIPYTLPDGKYTGQIKWIEEITAATSPKGTLTITTPYGTEPATHVFRAKKAQLGLVWLATGWHVFSKRRAGSLTVVVGTDVLTGEDMVETYNLSITGGQTSSGTKGIPDALCEGEVCWLRNTVNGGGTDAGVMSATILSLAGVAKVSASLNATTDYGMYRWDSSAWQEIINNSVTLA